MSELTEELKLKFQHCEQNELRFHFLNACKNGYLEIVRYLLTSPELSEHVDIHLEDDEGFRLAHKNNRLDVIRYLLASPELSEHANIHANHDDGFQLACQEGNLDVVKYLLTSPELKEHADIHVRNNIGFRWACIKDHLTIVQFLLEFCGEKYIDFQKTDYDLEWAISEKHDEIVKAMTLSLYKNDMINYLDNLPKIEKYCQQEGVNFQEWLNEIRKEDVDINSSVKEEKLFI